MAATDGERLDLADIQGDILRAYGNDYDRTSYLFAHLADAAGGRAWLSELVEQVTNAELWTGPKPETTLNVALTYAGLVALGLPQSVLGSFSSEFREGMAARAETLGDLGESAPAHWEAGLGTGEAHVLVTINAKTTELLQTRLSEFRAGVQHAAGVALVHEQHAQLLPRVREHFGFEDGFAQPAVAGVSDHKTVGGGVAEANGRWRALEPGEFILGYGDEDTRVDPQRRLPSAPVDPFGRSGTYMIYRQLFQDVALFRRTLHAAAELYEGSEEQLAAKVVGRWRNGTPLLHSPDAPAANFDPTKPSSNDFRYLDTDADGTRCPLGAHIRRANPRDALGWKGLDGSGLLSYRHRIIRRGMPYGPQLPPGVMEDDNQDRGLVFVCFNASISRQFEGIQLQWLGDGNAFHLGHDKDFLLGDGSTTGKMTVQGDPPFMLAPQQSFVTTRGGEYLFVPGIAALRALIAA
jgi:Dyp-type peroxidase family